MTTIVFNWFIRIASLSWLTGPIFDKELRVSSRRRRNYVLRFLYVTFFATLATLVWIEAVPRGSTSVFQVSRMSRAGQTIVMFIVWFQFIASQVIAIVMLSTAISDEIYNKTLGLLMTTPIGSLQIVLGKLLSKLLQLVLLLAITLPLLAIVRVFGGVPWSFLLCGLGVTLTTAIFLGSLSLFYSIFTRRAHTVIIGTFVSAGALFILVPLLGMLMFHRSTADLNIIYAVSYVNPYLVLSGATEGMMSAGGARFANWLAHCGIALAGSALLLLLATIFVRKVALRQATGQDVVLIGKKKGKSRRARSTAERLRRVVGPPVFWKERRTPWLGRLGVVRRIMGFLIVGLIVFTYILCVREGILGDEEVQVTYVIVFVSLGVLFTMVQPATGITSEKESRAWPILLTTTVSNWEILWGKFFGAVRRCSVAWVPLFAHVLLFTLFGMIHPLGILQLAILVAWITFFLCGTGLYFSTRFKRTTTAVVSNVALAASLWAIIPLLLAMIIGISRSDADFLELYMDTNPFVHAVVIMAATVGRGGLDRYDWIQGGIRDVDSAMAWIMFVFIAYVGVGTAFLARAWSRLRRNPL